MKPPRAYRSLILLLAAAVLLTGCADSTAEDERPTLTTTITQQPEDTVASSGNDIGEPRADTGDDSASSVAQARTAYHEVLNSPGQFPFTGGADYALTGNYDYALVEMTGDSTPELLLRATTVEHLDPIRVFSVGTSGSLIAPPDTLLSGAAGAGGYRAGINATASRDQILQAEWHSLRPEITVRPFVLDGERLSATGSEWKDSMSAPSGALLPITFHSINDRTPLEAMTPTVGEVYTPHTTRPVPAPQPSTRPDGGLTLSGQVQVMTAPELARHQGHSSTPNGEDDSHRFAVFILDNPTIFYAHKASDPNGLVQQEATMVQLGQVTPYNSDPTGFNLEGQRLTITFDPEQCGFPTDASLPLGQPRCGGYTIN
ncbi:hypothetical protein [Corynebacterium gallinarum]|uniref:Secreted protein n=1 Tax=Corynebacterium gallinarum TaxID=2762214 RepID=A0A8I0HG08_9CORY|nr:hypothetical protein [Corynebacterium gallinarum]MBD8029248.1 hypothetical protein [Corynebacterium gallinarum]NMB23859.1 hypothetical protein [Corynebacterium sp.]